MKRAAALTALFAVGLILALTLAGGGLGWYSTSTQTETTGTTETTTTTEVTETVLCPNGNPNTGGKDGHPGNDSCALDETTPPETTSPLVETTVPPTTETVTTTETSPATTETTETTATVTETLPPVVAPPVKPRKSHVKPPCKNGTPRIHGRCFPKVEGSG